VTAVTVTLQKLFEDFAALTMVGWQEMSREEIEADYGIRFEEVSPTARDFALAAVTDNVTAVRYAWTLANSVELLDVHLFVFDGENCAIERHYRVRATETI
jgi:hypothetical protein